MQLSSVPIDISSLRSQFTTLAVDLARTDAKLEDNEREGRRPTNGWDTAMSSYAVRLDDARMQLLQVRPDATDMAGELGSDSRHVAYLGGQLAVYQKNDLGFGKGWGSTLDDTIVDVQRAADLLDQSPLPPATPPVPPVTPPRAPGAVAAVIEDASRAAHLVRQLEETLSTLPANDAGSAATKDARLAAFNLNKQAQGMLEPHFSRSDAYVVSQLRAADAHLEDSAWQIQKKPSPDGRFQGIDIPGAQRDANAAGRVLEQLVAALSTGS